MPSDLRPSTKTLLRWLLFAVFGSVLPVIFNYLSLVLWSHKPTLFDVLKDGELYLISTAIAAAAIGELASELVSSEDNIPLRLVAAFVGFVDIVFAVFSYSALRSFRFLQSTPFWSKLRDIPNAPNINENALYAMSWVVFIFAIAVGFYATLAGTEHPNAVRIPSGEQGG